MCIYVYVSGHIYAHYQCGANEERSTCGMYTCIYIHTYIFCVYVYVHVQAHRERGGAEERIAENKGRNSFWPEKIVHVCVLCTRLHMYACTYEPAQSICFKQRGLKYIAMYIHTYVHIMQPGGGNRKRERERMSISDGICTVATCIHARMRGAYGKD